LDQKVPSIDRVVVDANLAGSIRAGRRLGEQALATLFEVSRTSIREALLRLETRGIIQVSPRRGWFVIEPSIEAAQEAFQARRAAELRMLHTATAGTSLAETLRDHIRRERDAISSGDVGARSYLLGDFHVCIAEACGRVDDHAYRQRRGGTDEAHRPRSVARSAPGTATIPMSTGARMTTPGKCKRKETASNLNPSTGSRS